MVNSLTTDENGTCTILDATGELTITVSKEGYTTKETSITVTEDMTLTIQLEEEDDSDLTDTLRNVRFTVKDGEGSGISEASINLVNTENSEITFANSNGGTGSSGGATIRNVSYGSYNVTVAKGTMEATFTLTVDETLAVTSGEDATITNNGVVVVLTE